ncbi:heat shock protein DnaJ domain-containing protein [Salinarchaeum sp. Harcht-Bsk1]|uniref:J domain-containing protein n=1 Tax=Salinarchaeum sp. Harcht-Bsk1 TaxID=1333523 RepID=UPI0003423357|nr:J domain-containing protein [Salinarchaeum sp. Harcht-Bsk1]AGN01907.1 heat shock protein DnaJ domain-containing protein [Salinarchaeum sp. Harcht-Bsk1]
MSEPHELLSVAPNADDATIRAAYRELLLEHHPDQGGSKKRFMQIKDAYERLVGDSRSGSITEPLSDGGATITPAGRCIEVAGKTVQGADGLELVAEADGLQVRLTTLTDRLPTGAMLPSHVESGRRVGACFHVTNESGRPVTWMARRVRFVGSQGERYLPTVYRPKRRKLPDRWRSDDVEIAPGDTARSFLLSRALPEDVAVETVVYDQQSGVGPARRVEFELDRAARSALDRPPFQ